MTSEPSQSVPQKNLPQVPVFEGYRLRDVQLEISLKPFYDDSPETREQVCNEIFHQWQALWRHAQSVSILLWIAEGSEILEYTGKSEATFEWARYHGAPNRHRWDMPAKSTSNSPDHAGIGMNAADRDPEGIGLHSRSYLYRDSPAQFTYAWLKELVADLKRIGTSITGLPVYVGNAFDIGPEFALSRFKYDWHREILSDGPVFKEQFVSCEAILHDDNRPYAGYPEGIPENLTFGTFLGRQTHCFLSDHGMDFIWLSNGFGFSLEPWAMVGQIFDGLQFHHKKAAPTKERILRFWHDLRAELPLRYHIRTRGTNLATGIDLGSDASPLHTIYESDLGVDAPVNSPWAALDGDFGLELTGWMSHLVRHPGDTFRYRFYSHDPWWLNSPWLDRYGRQPHDIFLPLSVSQVLEDGTAEIPRDIAILTIDDSHGQMPLSVPNEVIANFLRARETAPDEAGPIVWAYPFDDFNRMAFEAKHPERPFHADAFIVSVFNDGVPINTIGDLNALHTLARTMPEFGKGRVILLPTPQPGSEAEHTLAELIEAGWNLLVFGPLEPGSILLDHLGLCLTEAVECDFHLSLADILGNENGDTDRKLRHTSLLSAGGIRETEPEGGAVLPLVKAHCEDIRRTIAAATEGTQGGKIAWTRASLTTAEWDPAEPSPIRGPILKPLDPKLFFPPGTLLRRILRYFGWEISAEISADETRPTCLTAHRNLNAFIFSAYQRDPYTLLRLHHPLGAPLRIGKYQEVRDGVTHITGEVFWSAEVRVFMVSGENSRIECRNLQQGMHGVNRRILIRGLRNCHLRILPDPRHLSTLKILRNPRFPYFVGDFAKVQTESSAWGPVVEIKNADEELLIQW